MRNILKVPVMLTFACLMFAGVSFGQHFERNTNTYQKPTNRLLIGTGFGLQFGTITLIDVSPTIAYKLTDRLIPGIGFTYQYYRINYNTIPDYETSIYGGSAFLRYYVFEDFFAHGEYQVLSYERYNLNWELERVNFPAYLIGGGYRMMMSERFQSVIVVLFNLNETIDSPYQNPIIRFGVQLGL